MWYWIAMNVLGVLSLSLRRSRGAMVQICSIDSASTWICWRLVKGGYASWKKNLVRPLSETMWTI